MVMLSRRQVYMANNSSVTYTTIMSFESTVAVNTGKGIHNT